MSALADGSRDLEATILTVRVVNPSGIHVAYCSGEVSVTIAHTLGCLPLRVPFLRVTELAPLMQVA